MRSTRLFAALAMTMIASMSAMSREVVSRGMAVGAYAKPPKTAEPSRTVGSSRNGGRRSSNRMHQRMATKRRNQVRNRLAHRG